MAVTASFNPQTGILTELGDSLDNTITTSRDAAGAIFVNGGAVSVAGGTPTVANTSLIQVFGQGGNDTISLDEAIGALPVANLFGGDGNDTLTGGSGGDLLFGQSGNDTLLGKGGFDQLFGGDGDDVLTGGDGDDQMFGEAGNDRMIWNPGDDSDLMEGGDGVDTAEVNGGNGAETFTVTANGLRVSFDRVSPAPFSLDIGTTENLVLNMNDGDDSFSASGNLSALISVTVDGGAGNDTILGGNGADTLLGGDGNDFIDGNQGNDVALLGAGDDVFQWDPGDGSDTVEGQAGSDTLNFNGANINEAFEISANGGRALLTRNVGNIVMDLNDVEHLHFNALGGADIITVNDLSGTDASDVTVNLAATLGGNGGDGAVDTVVMNGGAGNDTFSVSATAGSVVIGGLGTQTTVLNAEATDVISILGNGGTDTTQVNGADTADTFIIAANGTAVHVSRTNSATFDVDVTTENLSINGGGGDDMFSASGNLAALISVTVDGGAGNDTILGGNGADTLLGGDGNDFIDGNQGNDVALLGAGDDVFQWDPGDGSDTVEGQAGSDTLNFNGANINEHIDISANGGRVQFTRDIGNIVMDLNDVEKIALNARGGTDNIVVNDLSGTDVTQVNISLEGIPGSGVGDDAVDTITINGTNGDDVIQILGDPSGIAILGLSAQVNILNFEPNNDQIIIKGAAGDDVIDASALQAGQLTADGGEGDDIYFVSNSGDTVQEGSGAGIDSVVASVDFTIPANVEVLYENGSGLTGTGSAGDDGLVSLGGPNTLVGQGGNDVYFVNHSGDLVQEGFGAGIDSVVASVDFTIPANVEVLYENGSGLTGTGSAGDDGLVSLGGPNTLVGQGGNDVYFVNHSGDLVQEGFGAGIDSVVASVDFTIPANVEVLYENGSGLTGTGSAGDDGLVSLGGPNTLVGQGGNDVYFVNHSGDLVQEGFGAGIDSVVASVDFTIPANVEALYENGSGLTGTGSAGDDILVSIGGANTLIGSGGDDTFVFLKGQSNGTTITDFDGNGPNAGDNFEFIGYGTAADGATLTPVDATHWSINSSDGLTHDIITLGNGANVDQSDFLFL